MLKCVTLELPTSDIPNESHGTKLEDAPYPMSTDANLSLESYE
ncbi:MAG: hypothetical protein WBA23_07290 [Tunicatimonas sp.]